MKSGDFFLAYLFNLHLEHSSTWTTTIEWTTTEVWTTIRSSRTARTTLTCLLTSEEIQAIYHMEHRIAVDGIILRIRTGCSRNGTRESALLTKDIIELEHDGKRLALQEALRELRIPYKLIGVHTTVVIATATVDRET